LPPKADPTLAELLDDKVLPKLPNADVFGLDPKLVAPNAGWEGFEVLPKLDEAVPKAELLLPELVPFDKLPNAEPPNGPVVVPDPQEEEEEGPPNVRESTAVVRGPNGLVASLILSKYRAARKGSCKENLMISSTSFNF
jgi:hypothetical protein